MDDDRHPRTAPGGALRIPRLVVRGLRLRCPACGRAKMFHGWFTMHEACPVCGRQFHRGPGFFLGSIYFNYGITAVLIVLMYFGFFFSRALTGQTLLVTLGVFALVFPLWFFRYARALWVAFDEIWDPSQ